MNDATPPLSAPRLPARARLPLFGFLPHLGWGFAYVVRWKKVALVALAAIGLGILIGYHAGRDTDAIAGLATVLDRAVLTFGLPLIALVLSADTFLFEITERTLVYQLVRPVPRATLYIARFVAGVVPAALVSLLFLVTVVLSSRADPDPALWATLPATAGLAALALGAVYFTLASLLRHGLVAGLIYTFVVEAMISSVPGSMQKLSVMFHVRSLHHQLTEGILPEVAPPARTRGIIQAAEQTADTPAGEAVLLLVGASIVLLVYGAWRVTKRDWAIKD